MDAKDGFLAIKGWQEITPKKMSEMGKELKDMGTKTVLFIGYIDGRVLSGINITKTIQIQDQGLNVIASAALKDMKRYKRIMQGENLWRDFGQVLV